MTKASWIDELSPGDRVTYDGDAATVFSVIRQRHMNAPDYFKLDFEDGSYLDVNDNELIANGVFVAKKGVKQP